jgi:hypothetical protein
LQVALGPAAEHPIFDFCDEESVMHSIDAFVEIGFYDHGYRHFVREQARLGTGHKGWVFA